MRGQSGFTLLELLVVMAVLGLALTTVPLAIDAGSGAALRASARDLARTLATLRADAMRQGQESELILDAADGLPPLPAGTRLSYAPDIPPLVGEVAEHLSFYPDGSSTGGSLTLTRRSARIVLHIAPLTGRIAIDD